MVVIIEVANECLIYNLNGSDDGVWPTEHWVSGVAGILNTTKQRFGNWICFRPQVKGGI
jgi:hypothetical protein